MCCYGIPFLNDVSEGNEIKKPPTFCGELLMAHDELMTINGEFMRKITVITIVLLNLICVPHAFAQAPTATTGAATGIGSSEATLNGTVNANGADTTVTFEYGLDNGYGGMLFADESPRDVLRGLFLPVRGMNVGNRIAIWYAVTEHYMR